MAQDPSATSLSLFTIPTTDDNEVINLEDLPISIEDIEAHFSVM